MKPKLLVAVILAFILYWGLLELVVRLSGITFNMPG
jgi:hypothetical protein